MRENDPTLDEIAQERISIMMYDGRLSEEEAIEYAELDMMERQAKGDAE